MNKDRKHTDEFDEEAQIVNDDESGYDDGADEAEVKLLDVGSTPVNFAQVGLAQVAYVRQSVVNNIPMWTIHSAAGDPLGAAHSFDQAWAAVMQNEMQPVRVH